MQQNKRGLGIFSGQVPGRDRRTRVALKSRFDNWQIHRWFADGTMGGRNQTAANDPGHHDVGT